MTPMTGMVTCCGSTFQICPIKVLANQIERSDPENGWLLTRPISLSPRRLGRLNWPGWKWRGCAQKGNVGHKRQSNYGRLWRWWRRDRHGSFQVYVEPQPVKTIPLFFKASRAHPSLCRWTLVAVLMSQVSRHSPCWQYRRGRDERSTGGKFEEKERLTDSTSCTQNCDFTWRICGREEAEEKRRARLLEIILSDNDDRERVNLESTCFIPPVQLG